MTGYIFDLTPEIACEALRAAGLFCSPDETRIVAREERWAVELPGERLASFPASQSASRRLAVERRVLRLLAERCSFRVPRTLLVSESGFEVRQMVAGRCDPWGLFERCKRDSGLARRVGRSLGAILALTALSAQTAALPNKDLVNDLVAANRVLAHEIHVLDAYGHVSVRDTANPSRYYLSRAISAGMVTASDIIEYDLDSNPIRGSRGDGYLERFIHGEIYKARPDVIS